MATGWTRRLASAPHAVAIAGTVLALAALGQAAAAAWPVAVHAGHAAPGRTPGEAVSLCLLALAVTVPLIFLRPAAAAVAITAASTVALAVFGSGGLTVAGLAAQVIASYRLGDQGVSKDAGLAGDGRRDLTPVLACGLAVPFLVLALDGHAGIATVLLVALVPAAAWAGIARRARGEAARQATAREVMAGTLADHMARGERARIARELHDVVAHHISMIAVQAETARLTTQGMPPAGAQRLLAIGDTARSALTEMRRLLGVLRPEGDSGKRFLVCSFCSLEWEFRRILCANCGESVSRQALTGTGAAANERTIDVQINRLRRKIETDPANPIYLQTARGAGYRLIVDG